MKKIVYVLVFTFLCTVLFYSSPASATDVSKPIIESIEVLTPKVERGGKVRIKVKANDDLAGVRKLDVRFALNQTGVTFFTWVDEGTPLKGEYLLEVELNKYAELGTWKAIQASATDFADKYSYYDTVGYGADPTPLLNVSFEVVEKTTPLQPSVKQNPVKNDGFKALKNRTNIALDGELTFTFNTDVATKSITQKNIYVTDKDGEIVPVIFIIDRASDKKTSEITIVSVDKYEKNSTYTVYIKDVYSTKGNRIRQYTKTQFTTVK